MDPWIDASTAPVRRAVLEPLAEWVREIAPEAGPVRLFDLGCGDILLAELLPGRITLDGWDPSPSARAAALRRAHALGRGQIFDRLTDTPSGSYDGVVLSSVVQYLDDPDELAALLTSATRLLRSGAPVGVLLTDVATGRRRWLCETLDLLKVVRGTVGLRRGLAVLVASAQRGPTRITVFTPREVAGAASRAELKLTLEPTNRSTLTTRASYRGVVSTTG